MATIVRCNCGAEYKRTETKFLVPHTGDAVCAVCGAALESWRKSTHVPSFELIKRPDRKPASHPKRPRDDLYRSRLQPSQLAALDGWIANQDASLTSGLPNSEKAK